MTFGLNLNVLAVLRSREMGVALNHACTDMNGTKVNIHVGPLTDVKLQLDVRESPDVLLVDVNPGDADQVGLLADILHKRFPNTPVVATAADATLQDVRLLMRLGVVDFVPQPITRPDLLTALQCAARLRPGANSTIKRQGKVVSFLKSGGGVGATSLAVQIGCALASRAKPAQPTACLLDLDIQFGTAALYLDLESKADLPDLVGSPERLDGSLLRGMMSRHESGLEVLGAPSEVLPLDLLSADFIIACLKIACQEHRFVLLDLPGAWTSWTSAALHHSDLILLVTELSVAGIRQARRQLDTLQRQALPEVPVKVVVNRFESGWGKTVSVKEAEKALGQKIDYFVINDHKVVSEAINQGVVLSRVKRGTKVEKSIGKVIDEIFNMNSSTETRAEPRLF